MSFHLLFDLIRSSIIQIERRNNLKKHHSLNDSDFNKLRQGFILYDSLFCEKTIIYTFNCENRLQKLSVHFEKTNFLHLSGISYYQSPVKFYNDLKSHHVNRNRLLYKNSQTKLKLDVLPELDLLIDCDQIRVTLNGSLLQLQFNNLIRSKKAIIALACDKSSSTSVSYPKSLLNLHYGNFNQKSFPVTNIQIFNYK